MTEQEVPEEEAPQGIPAEPEGTDDASDNDADVPEDEGEKQDQQSA